MRSGGPPEQEDAENCQSDFPDAVPVEMMTLRPDLAAFAACAWCAQGAFTPVAASAATMSGATQSGHGADRPSRAASWVR